MCVAFWLDFCCCFVLFYSYGFGGSEDICSLCMLRLVKNLLEPSFSFCHVDFQVLTLVFRLEASAFTP